MKTRIYLMGYMGSGKSTLGKRIATTIGYRFIDLDKAIEEHSQLSVAELFKQMGEAYFRQVETEVLRKISTTTKVIVALGGGTPCSMENLEIIRATGSSIYIKIPPRGLQNRLLHSKTIRPKIQGIKGDDLLEFIEKELKIREPFYSQANMIIDGQNYDKERLIEKVEMLLEYE